MNDSIPARVFLGVPAVLTASQRPYLEKWLEWLDVQALNIIRLERNAYGQEPLHALTKLISQADGLIVLGFRQLDADRKSVV